MEIAEYLTLVQDPGARRARYADLVRTYYAIAAHSGARAVGVNISPLQIDPARRRPAPGAGSVEFVEGDAQALPFPDAEFDAAYAIECLVHAPDKAGAFGEVARVLRGGAVFVGADWFVRDGLTPEERETWIEPISRAFMLPDLLSLNDLRETLTATGFQVSEITRHQDHGDAAPSWSVPSATVPLPYERPGEREVSEGALGLLRGAMDAGHFVLGCWIARKPEAAAAA